MVVEGTISNIVDFGAFVDLDGIDGLIHISELSWSHVNHPSRDPLDRRHGAGQGARHRPRPPAHLARPQADPGGPVAAGRRHLQRRRRARGQGHQGRHLRRVRRDPGRRRGPRAHLRARPAPRREPARDRRAGRRGEGQDPRDRLRAPPPVAVSIKRVEGQVLPLREREPEDGAAGAERPRAPATSTTCPSSGCPRTSSPATRSPPPRRGREAPRPPSAEAAPAEPAEAAEPSREPPPRPTPRAEAEPAAAGSRARRAEPRLSRPAARGGTVCRSSA